MKILLIGNGAAGCKAVLEAVETSTVKEDDTLMINSTSKDFPAEYAGKKIVLTTKDTGAGKEREVAKEYMKSAIKRGLMNLENIGNYDTIIIAASCEGGTGSGSTPMLAKYFNKVLNKNVHIVCFTGFEEDVRGLANTVDFFKEIDPALVIHTISNKSFMREAMQNKYKAEQMANAELCKMISVISGQDFVISNQNIDDTDILKVSNTSGYMTVEKKYLEKPLETQDDFNAIIKKMIYNSHSIKSEDPGCVRLGVILNLDPASEDAVDSQYSAIKDVYGKPYEVFTQKQWDGKKEYIAFICSGMQLPLDELKALYERYKEESSKVNKNADEFFSALGSMETLEEDKKFDMIKPVEAKGISVDDFLSNL